MEMKIGLKSMIGAWCLALGAETALALDVAVESVAIGAVQQAVDRVFAAGGGTVRVPKGNYPVAFLELKDNVTLDLAEGARLYAETNALRRLAVHRKHEHDQCQALIVSHGARNVAIVGKGEVDGLGQTFRPTSNNTPGRWKLVILQDTDGIRIEGVTLRNTPAWTCHIRCCEGVEIRNATIDADRTIANSDGFSIDCTRNVKVSGCTIRTGDDGFAIRASCRHHAATNLCENIEFRIARSRAAASASASASARGRSAGCPSGAAASSSPRSASASRRPG